MDVRLTELANLLLTHSISLKPGEKVYVEYKGSGADSFVEEVIRKIYEFGGIPFLHHIDQNLKRELLMHCTEEQIKLMSDLSVQEMKQMDCFIGIRSYMNSCELSSVPAENMAMFTKLYDMPVHLQERVNHTKWVILQYPTPGFAQAAGMSTNSFEDFYFKSCIMDYKKLYESMKPLVDLMLRTDKVHIVGPGTDLRFSIKDINVIPCYGKRNIPDGEVFTAPVKDSIEGYLSYNTPSVHDGYTFENIRFEFSKGKIVNATANNTSRINQILDTDEGSRFIGEFSLGVNPFIENPMKDTLFDEKISGSFHFTPGHCYTSAPNGNASAIHWDLVCIQTSKYGGGEIYFDDILVRKDGIFVLDSLKGLNPENY